MKTNYIDIDTNGLSFNNLVKRIIENISDSANVLTEDSAEKINSLLPSLLKEENDVHAVVNDFLNLNFLECSTRMFAQLPELSKIVQTEGLKLYPSPMLVEA